MSIDTNTRRFSLPEGAEYFVALQRTAYQHPIQRLVRRLGLGRRYDQTLLRHVERFRRNRIGELYLRDVRSDFEQILPHLPERADRILDIGCGMGGIDVLLWQHYCNPELHLFDKSGVSPIHYGLEATAAHYNSQELSQLFLASNGVPAERAFSHAAESEKLPDARFELILSLISWGFHYPVSTYLEQAATRLAEGGRLILDARTGFDGLPLLRTRFARVEVIRETPKFTRVVAQA